MFSSTVCQRFFQLYFNFFSTFSQLVFNLSGGFHVHLFELKHVSFFISLFCTFPLSNKLASLEATLARNYDRPTNWLTGVKCRATSVAKNIFSWHLSVEYHHDIPMTVKNTLHPLSGRTFGKISVEQHHDIEEKSNNTLDPLSRRTSSESSRHPPMNSASSNSPSPFISNFPNMLQISNFPKKL